MENTNEKEERLKRGIERSVILDPHLNKTTNIHLSSISKENPLFILTSRSPAHVACLDSPQLVYEWLSDRLDNFADDPVAALDFEIVDFARS